jgi:hypothetical protein
VTPCVEPAPDRDREDEANGAAVQPSRVVGQIKAHEAARPDGFHEDAELGEKDTALRAVM